MRSGSGAVVPVLVRRSRSACISDADIDVPRCLRGEVRVEPRGCQSPKAMLWARYRVPPCTDRILPSARHSRRSSERRWRSFSTDPRSATVVWLWIQDRASAGRIGVGSLDRRASSKGGKYLVKRLPFCSVIVRPSLGGLSGSVSLLDPQGAWRSRPYSIAATPRRAERHHVPYSSPTTGRRSTRLLQYGAAPPGHHCGTFGRLATMERWRETFAAGAWGAAARRATYTGSPGQHPRGITDLPEEVRESPCAAARRSTAPDTLQSSARGALPVCRRKRH